MPSTLPTSCFLAFWPGRNILQSDIVLPAFVQLSLFVKRQILPVSLPCRTTPTSALSLEGKSARSLARALVNQPLGWNPVQLINSHVKYTHPLLSQNCWRILSGTGTTTKNVTLCCVFPLQKILWVPFPWKPSLLAYVSVLSGEAMDTFGDGA